MRVPSSSFSSDLMTASLYLLLLCLLMYSCTMMKLKSSQITAGSTLVKGISTVLVGGVMLVSEATFRRSRSVLREITTYQVDPSWIVQVCLYMMMFEDGGADRRVLVGCSPAYLGIWELKSCKMGNSSSAPVSKATKLNPAPRIGFPTTTSLTCVTVTFLSLATVPITLMMSPTAVPVKLALISEVPVVGLVVILPESKVFMLGFCFLAYASSRANLSLWTAFFKSMFYETGVVEVFVAVSTLRTPAAMRVGEGMVLKEIYLKMKEFKSGWITPRQYLFASWNQIVTSTVRFLQVRTCAAIGYAVLSCAFELLKQSTESENASALVPEVSLGSNTQSVYQGGVRAGGGGMSIQSPLAVSWQPAAQVWQSKPSLQVTQLSTSMMQLARYMCVPEGHFRQDLPWICRQHWDRAEDTSASQIESIDSINIQNDYFY